jgi:hypothetical protein
MKRALVVVAAVVTTVKTQVVRIAGPSKSKRGTTVSSFSSSSWVRSSASPAGPARRTKECSTGA